MMKMRNKKGFTLMEMLIVVAIIAILVAIAIPTFSNALTKAKIAADKANVRAWYAEELMDHMLNGTALTTTYDGKTLNYASSLKIELVDKNSTTTSETSDDTWVLTYTDKLNSADNLVLEAKPMELG